MDSYGMIAPPRLCVHYKTVFAIYDEEGFAPWKEKSLSNERHNDFISIWAANHGTWFMTNKTDNNFMEGKS